MTVSRRTVLVGAVSVWAAGRAAAAQRPALVIQPLGPVAPSRVAALQEALGRSLGLPVQLRPPLDLPAVAFHEPRRRYRAERLLTFLAGRTPRSAKLLGLTSVDISTTKDAIDDWGILGLAEIGGGAAVVSTFRCRRRARGAAHLQERLLKVAMHELGHTFGLDHCRVTGCLLQDLRGQLRRLDGARTFCGACLAHLRGQGVAVPGAR